MLNPFLIGQRIYLRAPEPGDETIAAMCENHPDPRAFLFYGLPSSRDMQSEKIEKFTRDPNTVLFIICEKEGDSAIGQTAFFRIDWLGRMAVFYIAIAEKENWSKGYGGEATTMMVRYAFETLNLNRIQLHVNVNNTRAVAVYQKAGFSIEGTLRQAMYFDGQYMDFYVMAILREEWKPMP